MRSYPGVMSSPDLIHTKQVSAILGGLHVSTISRWAKDGILVPALRAGEGRAAAMLFDRADVERLAADLRALAGEPEAVAS